MIIKVIQGNTQALAYSVVLDGGKGEDIDLSFVTAKIMVKKKLTDPDSKAVAFKELVHPESNLLYYELTASETAKMTVGKYYIDFALFYDSGAVKTLRQDVLIIEKGVFNG